MTHTLGTTAIKEMSATLVQLHDQNSPRKIGNGSAAGYNY